MKPCYIFGYGSLINSHSRSITGLTGQSTPIIVHDVKRSWIASSQRFPLATVGVEPNSTSQCNGVIFPITENELANFDEREQAYYRAKLPLSQIEFLEPDVQIDSDVWIYYVERTDTPCEHRPIAQSYFDVIVEGCLEIGHHFMKHFIETTNGWDHPWLNDRNKARYPRHELNGITYQEIDQTIMKYIPDLKTRRIAA